MILLLLLDIPFIYCYSVQPRYTNITGNTRVWANGVNKVTLTCNTDSSNPRSTITWYRNGQQIGLTSQTTHTAGLYGGDITTQALEFIPTREMDGHTIECRAANQLSGADVAVSSVQFDVFCKLRECFFEISFILYSTRCARINKSCIKCYFALIILF